MLDSDKGHTTLLAQATVVQPLALEQQRMHRFGVKDPPPYKYDSMSNAAISELRS